jgi:hypothetical protein
MQSCVWNCQMYLRDFHTLKSDVRFFQELLCLYGQVVRADRVKSSVQSLSEDARSFIRESLLLDPVNTNSVIQHLLCVWCPHFLQMDDELQKIYTEALELCILELENRDSRTSINKCNCFNLYYNYIFPSFC